jgi:hypothetical protein
MNQPYDPLQIPGWLPQAVLLNPRACQVLDLICLNLDEHTGNTIISVRQLADQAGCTPGTIYRALKRLLENELIERQPRYHNGRRLSSVTSVNFFEPCESSGDRLSKGAESDVGLVNFLHAAISANCSTRALA